MLSLCSQSFPSDRVFESELKRAYALIDVLRNADVNETPLDLIYLYLTYTCPTNFLRNAFFRGLYETNDDKVKRSMMNNMTIPKGLVTMASRYLVRCCKAHLCGIRQLTEFNRWNDKAGCTEWALVKCYPVEVGQALDRIVIPSCVELKEVKHVIDALHAAICPVFTDKTMAAASTRKIPLTRQQVNRVADLFNLFSRTMALDDSYLDAFSRGTLCNLLEILLILDTRGVGYIESAALRELQCYSRISACDRGSLVRKPDTFFPVVNEYRDAWNFLDRPLAILSKLSPQAALCLGMGVNVKEVTHPTAAEYDFMGQLDALNISNLLNVLNYSSRETFLYVKYELFAEQKNVMRLLKDGTVYSPKNNGREG